MPRTLALFTRDLRLADNALFRANDEHIPAFILDDDLLSAHHNQFAQQFMAESLLDLNRQLKHHTSSLSVKRGTFRSALTSLIAEHSPARMRMSRDVTPYAKHREKLAGEICSQHNVELEMVDNHWLLPFTDTLKNDGEPFKVFTPFYHHANSLEVPMSTTTSTHFAHIDSSDKLIHDLIPKTSSTRHGGRSSAEALLRRLTKLRDYQTARDFPAQDATTHLSAQLHWGTVSAREAYWHVADTFDRAHPIIRQLWWREFYSSIAHHFPHVWRHNFRREFDELKWDTNPDFMKVWQRGETGFPIVDAAMRCLNTTGEMHNRLRMIVASFLTKDLHINWREGEEYFAQTLMDFDKAVNNGNWQWVAGTGADAAPYFRIFNPWLQQAKFDTDAEFIKTWLPELTDLPAKTIHDPKAERPNYPQPIVDHRTEAAETLALYQKIRKDS